jgi:hypothetical protein
MDIETEPEITKRGPGRPRKDENEPVIARAPIRTEVRERKRKSNSSEDKFAIPAHLIPPGTSLEWKRESVVGQEDPHYMAALHENGWRPVDVSMIPTLMPEGYKGAIRMGGQVLMERPIELTREAQAEDRDNARRAVQIKEDQLRGAVGAFRGQRPDGGADVRISKSVEPGIIPD